MSILPGHAAAQQRATINAFPAVSYYLGYTAFESSVDGQIRITAGDKYTLYLNGDLVGADDDPTTVETWDASFKRKSNIIAVVVEYSGTRPEYGFFLVLDAEDVQKVSSPTDRISPWFWTGFPLPNEDGAKWTKIKQNKLGQYEENDQEVTWLPTQAGSLAPSDFADFADLDLTRAQSLAGFPGGMDPSDGLQLRSLAGENLAFNTFSDEPKLVDGDVGTPVTFRKGVSALGQSVEIDIGSLFPINRVRVLTQPPSRLTWEDHSVRGYSVLVSKDGVSFLDVASRNQISEFQETEVVFPTTPARFVRLVITEFANRNSNPRVGEIEVFGTGVSAQGTYLSPPLDLGLEAVKDFGSVRQYSDIPSNTEMDLRFRSGNDGQDWSAWSSWSREQEILPNVPEPRRFLQYQARMVTRQLTQSPRLDSLEVSFNTDNLAVTEALAAVVPLEVPIGMDTTFTYSLMLRFSDGDAGVSRLVILTPWPARLDLAALEGVDAAAVDAANTYATNDSLIISFNPPITADADLVIPFATRLLAATHNFQGLLFAPESTSPFLAQQREGVDPETEIEYSLTAETTDFDLPILADVGAHPGVFTPNGDGVNDQVVLGFTLARVNGALVNFEIYDLSGRLVRALPGRQLNAGLYAPSGSGLGTQLPGSWDGRADGGDLLPPGLYLYRVVVELDPDEEVATGVVGLAY
jgi:hypothetical protein